MKKNIKPFFLFVLFFITSSCAFVSPKDKTLSFNEKIKENNNIIDYKTGEFSNFWWEDFNNLQLNLLIKEALKDSFKIKIAFSKLNQARFLSEQQFSYIFPEINLKANASQNIIKNKSQKSVSSQDYSLGLASSYELDLWGRVYSLYKGANFEYKASKEDYKTARISLAAEIAKSFYAIVYYKKQTKLLEKNVKLEKQYLEMVTDRYKKGLKTRLDISQEKKTLFELQAGLEKAKSLLETNKETLFALLGRAENKKIKITNEDIPNLLNIPKNGIPSNLLEVRPDIKKASYLLKSSDWQLKSAKTNLLPKFSITASASFTDNQINSIFDNWITNLASNITMPIFNMGRTKNDILRKKAISNEKFYNYKQTVIEAVKEVQTALINEKRQENQLNNYNQANKQASSLYEQTLQRYKNGMTDALTVIKNKMSVNNAKRASLEAKYLLLGYRISLYRALGNSWQDYKG